MNKNNKNKIYILSFDPGTNFGVALSKYNIKNNELEILITNCYNLNKLINKMKNTESHYISNEHSFKQIIIRNIIKYYIKRFPINIFVSEEGYIHTKFPQAAYSIVNNITLLDSQVYSLTQNRLYTIHNKTIKRILSTGDANKLDIKYSVLDNEGIKFNLLNKKNIFELTEHEYDAIAVAYTFTKLINIF